MKFVSFTIDGVAMWGTVKGDVITALGQAGSAVPSLRSYLDCDPRPKLSELACGTFALGEVSLCPVIPKSDMIALAAVNYREGDVNPESAPQFPVLFLRLSSSQIGHEAPLIQPRESQKLDFEGELAVIIGKAGRYISRENAYDHVAGYAVYNDASVRDWQKHSHQFTAGKNFTGTGAFGPFMVTPDAVPALESGLALTTKVNGEIKQSTDTSKMIFDVPYLINYISTFAPLAPGDVIVTGTCTGFGITRNPPEFLRIGDVVEVEIDGIGRLRNTVQAAPDSN
ncbi:2-keto-4-pentenoate hydratase/2-oxohepta-3-ene-1,7-dioic acid hydratase in catechol pathway [Pacificibacter maritimus]|uniref:2-keto-4-pentenoate hydratase/2-oxohepta-3-ene-1,7-dioic acid hydratase in catechol pathway n=1 Tax=Pacificibacter maritimus TaxID=762213 RepID=A0A3N4U764_9RHOB|nr:fumarylacetoacetate hydrolase family protein [Pacificibacter maritimus]RPE62941.1 2-keto-4-pentenoate hydratase/2-oxohepta-3-ene-1,7-dioic acid hydratase in catechol pathway [Pacificibacter maritimus]